MLRQNIQDSRMHNDLTFTSRYLQRSAWFPDLLPTSINTRQDSAEVMAFNELLINVHDQILLSLCSRIRNKNSDWMEHITDDAVQFFVQQRKIHMEKLQREATLNQASATLIEQIFAWLQIYSYEFNYNHGWNTFIVTCTKPSFVTETISYNKYREPIETVTKFRARLSTRNISLVICGDKNSIQFFILPSEEVIGLSKAESQYEPIIELKSILIEDEIEWTINDKTLTNKDHEQMCTELFTQLIESSKQASKSYSEA